MTLERYEEVWLAIHERLASGKLIFPRVESIFFDNEDTP